MSLCSESLATLKALRAVRTTCPLIYQCQRALNDTSVRHAVGHFGSPDVLDYVKFEIADGFATGGSALEFFGPEPSLGVSRRDLQKSLGRWLVNQHLTQWRGLGNTQRQAREIISGPILGTRANFMTLSRIQSRVVSGLLTGHNTMRRDLYLLGLSNRLL